MAQSVSFGVGNEGSKANKGTQTTPGTPGAVVGGMAGGGKTSQQLGGTDPTMSFLDSAFGDRPLYKVAKAAHQQGWCGNKPGASTPAAGMKGPSAASTAAQNAQAASALAAPAASEAMPGEVANAKYNLEPMDDLGVGML